MTSPQPPEKSGQALSEGEGLEHLTRKRFRVLL